MSSRALWFLLLVLAAAAVLASCNDDNPTEPPIAAECGGFQGIPCATGQTCELPAGQCQTADLAGECVDIPDFCTQDYVPVCGCDGVTYSNDCTRVAAQAQKSHDGECA